MGSRERRRAGLGRAVPEALLCQDFNLAMNCHTSAAGVESARQSARPHARVRCFAADRTSDDDAIDQAASAAGLPDGFDFFVNNTAELTGRRKIEDPEPDFWHRMLVVNLPSTMFITFHPSLIWQDRRRRKTSRLQVWPVV